MPRGRIAPAPVSSQRDAASSSARRVRTRARCRRNSELAAWSAGGSVPSAATAAASSIDAAARERLLGRGRTQRRRSHVRERDRRSSRRAVRALDDSGDRHRRPVLGAAVHLHVRPSARAELRHADLDEQLVVRERRLEHAREQVGCGDRPHAALASGDHLAVQRQDERRAGRTRDRRARSSLRWCRGAGPGGRRPGPRPTRRSDSARGAAPTRRRPCAW